MNDPQRHTHPPDPLPHRRRKRRSVWLGVLILLLGMVIGSFGSLALVGHVVRQHRRHPQKLPAHITAQVRRRLSLDDAQTEQVNAILSRRLANLRAIRDEVQPRVVHEFDMVEQEVAVVLDEPQLEKWRHACSRWRQFFNVPPSGPPPENGSR